MLTTLALVAAVVYGTSAVLVALGRLERSVTG